MTEALERDVEKKAPTSFAERQGRMYYLCLTHSNPAGHISVHVEGATRGTSRTLATPKLQRPLWGDRGQPATVGGTPWRFSLVAYHVSTSARQ